MEYLDASFKVSRIGLGTWAIDGCMWGGTDETAAIGVIHEAVDRGVALIDTAPAYSFGRSEEIVGKALAESGCVSASSSQLRSVLTGRTASRSATAARREFAKRSRIHRGACEPDVIDIYQVHWSDPNVPIEEAASAMADLQCSGKIRAIGVNNFSPAQIDGFRKVVPVQTAPSPYNLFERAIEADVLHLLPRQKYRHACLRVGVQGSPLRPHDGADAVCRGRPEKDRPKVPRTSISAIPSGGRKARPVRASQLRKARHPSCLALGSRSAGLDDRALVRACPTNSPRSRSSPVAASTRPPWLKSIGFFDHSRGRRGSGIHGPACSACSLRAPKSSPPAGRRLA
jgi:hypothetical protein